MTFDEFIQDGLSKANKLFGKLAATGPNAVKTRERLFLDLKAELNHLGRFERNHLIPALGEHKKTRPLIKSLEKDAEKVSSLLVELDSAPRAGDAFLQKLTELQGAFQAHVRDDRKQLLPAVLDALQRVQKAEQDAAEEAAAQAAAEIEAAELKAAELKAAEHRAAQAQAEADAKAAASVLPVESPPPAAFEASAQPAPALSMVEAGSAETIETSAPAAETLEAPRLPIPAPLAAIAILHTLAAPLTPPGIVPIEPPKPAALPLPTAAYGLQSWANLMQEAAAGALMGYRLMLAYSNNTGFAALQTRLMKEQIELMTQSGYKLIEAAQRLGKTASTG